MKEEISTERAANCFTHHHACDCREWLHQEEVDHLKWRIEDMEKSIAAYQELTGRLYAELEARDEENPV